MYRFIGFAVILSVALTTQYAKAEAVPEYDVTLEGVQLVHGQAACCTEWDDETCVDYTTTCGRYIIDLEESGLQTLHYVADDDSVQWSLPDPEVVKPDITKDSFFKEIGFKYFDPITNKGIIPWEDIECTEGFEIDVLVYNGYKTLVIETTNMDDEIEVSCFYDFYLEICVSLGDLDETPITVKSGNGINWIHLDNFENCDPFSDITVIGGIHDDIVYGSPCKDDVSLGGTEDSDDEDIFFEEPYFSSIGNNITDLGGHGSTITTSDGKDSILIANIHSLIKIDSGDGGDTISGTDLFGDIEIDSGDGADTIDIDDITIDYAVISGGAGDDTIEITNADIEPFGSGYVYGNTSTSGDQSGDDVNCGCFKSICGDGSYSYCIGVTSSHCQTAFPPCQ